MSFPKMAITNIPLDDDKVLACGDNGELYAVTQEFAQGYRPFQDADAPWLSETGVDIIRAPLDETGLTHQDYPVKSFLVGRQTIRAAYAENINRWFIKGQPERIPLTFEEFIRGE